MTSRPRPLHDQPLCEPARTKHPWSSGLHRLHHLAPTNQVVNQRQLPVGLLTSFSLELLLATILEEGRGGANESPVLLLASPPYHMQSPLPLIPGKWAGFLESFS